jgi:hypothetical protein
LKNAGENGWLTKNQSSPTTEKEKRFTGRKLVSGLKFQVSGFRFQVSGLKLSDPDFIGRNAL